MNGDDGWRDCADHEKINSYEWRDPEEALAEARDTMDEGNPTEDSLDSVKPFIHFMSFFDPK
jgi:hypothetical protein